MKLVFSEASVRDLERLREFIATHNPDAARRVARRLHGAILKLRNNPQIGRPVPDLPGEIREYIVGKYITRYEIRNDMMYILRIWHGREDR